MTLVGVNARNLERIGFTILALAVVSAIGQGIRFLFRLALRDRTDIRARFVSQQIVQILTGILLVIALVSILDLDPRVFLRLTDNWVELAVRFVAATHGVRALKDRMSREIIDALDAAKIGVASGTYAVVQMPTLRVKLEGPADASAAD